MPNQCLECQRAVTDDICTIDLPDGSLVVRDDCWGKRQPQD